MARSKKVLEESVAVQETEVTKTAPKKTATKKAEAEPVKETEPVKEEAPKKAAPKKTAAKKAEPAVTVTIQFNGKDIVAKDVLEAAKKAYAEKNPEGEIKSMDLYVKPDEGVAYYAVNGEGNEDYKIQL
jgi:hypothetical protein